MDVELKWKTAIKAYDATHGTMNVTSITIAITIAFVGVVLISRMDGRKKKSRYEDEYLIETKGGGIVATVFLIALVFFVSFIVNLNGRTKFKTEFFRDNLDEMIVLKKEESVELKSLELYERAESNIYLARFKESDSNTVTLRYMTGNEGLYQFKELKELDSETVYYKETEGSPSLDVEKMAFKTEGLSKLFREETMNRSFGFLFSSPRSYEFRYLDDGSKDRYVFSIPKGSISESYELDVKQKGGI